MHIPTPAGISVLVGDPGMVVNDAVTPNAWTVYVSSLAVSDAGWAQLVKTNNCITLASFQALQPDRVCVNAIAIPFDGSTPFSLPNLSYCVGASTAAYDGTALSLHVPTGQVYLATNNTTANTIDLFIDGNQTVNPLPNSVFNDHPIMAKSFDAFVHIVAPDRFGTFWYAMGTGGNWTSGQMASGFRSGQDYSLAGGKKIRSIGYSADVGSPGGIRHLQMFFATAASGGIKRLQGVDCTSPSTCTTLPNSITPSGSNALLPAVVWVYPFLQGPIPWLSYWTDNTTPTGNLQLMFARVSPTDGSLTTFTATGVNETPCPNADYWGDYDAMTVGDNNPNSFGIGGSFAFLLRYLTDSTASACNDNGGPQHVSVTLGDPDQ